RKPTDEQLRQVVEDFFNGVGEISDNYSRKHERPWWIVLLPGTPSNPLKRIFPEVFEHQPPGGKERWLEVVVDDGSVDVLTRQADDFTNALADGLAEVLCRGWSGRAILS